MLSSGSPVPLGRRMHLMKRRKLAHPPPSAAKQDSWLLPACATANHLKTATVCASCHRAFFGSKQGQLVQCARCHAATCVICSRTCNGCLPCLPPTMTSTPDASKPDACARLPMPLPFSRRPALALHTKTALGAAPPPMAGRRRKMRDRDDAEDDDEGRGHTGDGDGESGKEKQEDGVLPGCERTVCRNCAFEIPDRELTTCYDCAARLMGQATPHP
ncbi:hypothetical protein K466DRAFT_588366 [Polyporus arcularius HHB13444]|uniref:Uncharacterized protein n=1 Tax=Polyporus arcularius HHB13444 TaxID=1314778 RepID=A0A5C3P872_9APHY|nr:hypothetical protein K466DRAFT_588366 [Polyporus arcularius HHB13444]